jgi:rod shape-determining protein MreC
VISLRFRQTAILILIFLITCVGLIALDQQHRLDGAKSPAEDIIQPFQAAMSRAGNSIHHLQTGSPSATQQQLQQVTAERNQLLADNARMKDLEQQVSELQKQLGFKQSRPELNVVSANVVGQDPNGTTRTLVIDQGSSAGIQMGMAVISPDFLVGQVTEVSSDRSRVTLAIDSSSHIGAMMETSSAAGVLFGEWQSGGQMQLRDLDPATSVNEGDVVVTSGQTARVPAGLVIGKVASVDRNVQSAELNVNVAPLLDFNKIQSVMVILSDKSQP